MSAGAMRLKDIECVLSDIRPFRRPRVELEQYATEPHVAARIGIAAADAIADEAVLDLGCGCAMLSAAAAVCGAGFVIGVDIDEDALSQARENIERAELEGAVDFVRADVRSLPRMLRGSRSFGAAITNPPFGTKDNAGVDLVFLRVAASLVRRAVYSLHKTSTRAFVERRAREASGGQARAIAELRFEIPRQFRFHKHRSVHVDVDLIETLIGLNSVSKNQPSSESDSGDSVLDTEDRLED